MSDQDSNLTQGGSGTSPKRTKEWVILTVIVLAFMSMVGINQLSKLKPSGVEKPSSSPQASAIAQVETCDGTFFDVPSLIGMDFDGVAGSLGEPKGIDPTQEQIELGTTEWDKTFIKDDKELLVTYTIADKKIIDFFISGLELTDQNQQNKKCLLEVGNITQDDSRYSVEFVKAIKDPTQFTGVKITPN